MPVGLGEQVWLERILAHTIDQGLGGTEVTSLCLAKVSLAHSGTFSVFFMRITCVPVTPYGQQLGTG